YDHPVEPAFFAFVVVLQIGRLWVLATLGRRWTIRIIVVSGGKAGGARSLPMVAASKLCGGDRRDRGSAAGARTAALCACVFHSQCCSSCDPHPHRKRGDADWSNVFLATRP